MTIIRATSATNNQALISYTLPFAEMDSIEEGTGLVLAWTGSEFILLAADCPKMDDEETNVI